MKLLKDSNYYKRMGKLIHLKIDTDAQKHIRSLSGKDMEKEYSKFYNSHPLYSKMQTAIRKAATCINKERHSTSLASLIEDNSLSNNLIRNICSDIDRQLGRQGINNQHQNYWEMMRNAIYQHENMIDLQSLIGE